MYVMNKNVNHNGKLYPKGSEIKPGDDGFKDLVKAGHASAVGGQAEAKPQEPVEAPIEAPVEAEGVSEEKPARKGKSKR